MIANPLPDGLKKLAKVEIFTLWIIIWNRSDGSLRKMNVTLSTVGQQLKAQSIGKDLFMKIRFFAHMKSLSENAHSCSLCCFSARHEWGSVTSLSVRTFFANNCLRGKLDFWDGGSVDVVKSYIWEWFLITLRVSSWSFPYFPKNMSKTSFSDQPCLPENFLLS